jgi:hypothetical protein
LNNIRLEKGIRTIFVPHSAGVYVSINLINNVSLNYDSNFELNKYYKCNAILNLDCLENELKELLMYIFIKTVRDNSLILIGKVSKLTDHTITSENNPFGLPEDNDYILVDLDKIDYIIGFQGEEMIFRNYLF